MKTKKQSYPPLQIGTSFMLVIFIILCMVVFAVLSLSTAQKDYEYSQKNAIRTTEFYEANNLAEEQLAEIDSQLHHEASETDYGDTVEYTVPINDNETLQVVLALHPHSVPRYTILTWKKISTENWTGDQSLPVLGSE